MLKGGGVCYLLDCLDSEGPQWEFLQYLWHEIFGNQNCHIYTGNLQLIINRVHIQLMFVLESIQAHKTRSWFLLAVLSKFPISTPPHHRCQFLDCLQLMLFSSLVISKQSERRSEPKRTCSQGMWSFNLSSFLFYSHQRNNNKNKNRNCIFFLFYK